MMPRMAIQGDFSAVADKASTAMMAVPSDSGVFKSIGHYGHIMEISQDGLGISVGVNTGDYFILKFPIVRY
jgi:hypothetical protein